MAGAFAGLGVGVGNFITDEFPAGFQVYGWLFQIKVNRLLQLCGIRCYPARPRLAEALMGRPVADLCQRQIKASGSILAARRVNANSQNRALVNGRFHHHGGING